MIRVLRSSDIPAVLGLVDEAGWNQTADDISMLLRLAPEGCWGMELDGRVVATTTLLPLNDHLAWLGMVLTASAYRRRGLARQLVECALGRAAELRIGTVKLDATDTGRPLYLDVGFREEQPVERWRGALMRIHAGTNQIDNPNMLLRELARRSEVFTENGAFAMVRPGARARYLGPFLADNPEVARELVRHNFTANAGEDVYQDVLPRNRDAVRLLEELGFSRARSLVRMSYGRDYSDPQEHQVYGIRGFELG